MNCLISSLEYNVLRDWYGNLSGPSWTQTNASRAWQFPSPLSEPCSVPWQGLTCNVSSITPNICSITALDLNDYNLYGEIPRSITGLVHLTRLNVMTNNISGTLQDEFTSFSVMQQLGLCNNSFSGSLPTSWSDLSHLKELIAYHNMLSGEIPSTWSSMQNISSILIQYNNFNGTLSNSWSSMKSLAVLRLDGNQLTGNIPVDWSSMSSLFVLNLADNLLSGGVPVAWSCLTRLRSLHLQSNYLSGPIPIEWSALTSIKELSFYLNMFTGTLPVQWSVMSHLKELSFSFNQMNGTLPDAWSQLTSMFGLSLFSNHFSGSLPASWKELIKLNVLYLYSNILTGHVPPSWSTLRNLTSLYICSNHLSGPIPSSWSTFTALQVFAVHINSFTGPLPALANYQNLQILYLFENSFQGTIPDSWSRLYYIGAVKMYSNSLTGTMPASLSTWSKLLLLYANDNFLSGTLSPHWSSASSNHIISVSNNMLEGSLPNSWSAISSFQAIYLSFNSFSSTLPTSWNVLSYLEIFDVSFNVLSGKAEIEIPIIDFLNLGENLFSSLEFGLVPGLVILNASNNVIDGTLSPINSKYLQYIDLSNNEIEGNVYAPLSTSVQTIILSSNCFKGSIDPNFCNLPKLGTLILDNLHDSYRCQNYHEILQRPIYGSVPTCLFSLPKLQTIRLIGNGLSGSLPDISKDSQLQIVGLTSNRMNGTIPSSWQSYGKFKQLLLSFNRLTGTLDENFNVTYVQNMNMSVNRLSGGLPNSFAQLPTMDVVEGNIFGCFSNYGNDIYAKTYSCGSLELDVVLIVYSIGVALLVCFILYSMKKATEFAVEVGRSNLNHEMLVVLAVICILILIVCEILSHEKSTTLYQVRYAWTTTTIDFHGFYSLSILILVTIANLWIIWHVNVSPYVINQNKEFTNGVFEFSWLEIFRLRSLGLQLINVIVIGSVTTFYVYVVLNVASSNTQLVCSAICAAIKVLWNSVFVNTVFRKKDDAIVESHLSAPFSNELFADIFGFVLCPLVVVFFTSSDCFKYAVNPIAPIETHFQVHYYSYNFATYTRLVQNYLHVFMVTYVVANTLNSESTVYPVWEYTFQCSSGIMTSYLPVIIYTYLFSSVLLSALKLIYIWNLWHESDSLQSVVLRYLFVDVYKIPDSADDIYSISKYLTQQSISCTSMLHRKMIRHIIVFLIFGLASPILGIIIIFNIYVDDVIIRLQIKYIGSDIANRNICNENEIQLAMDQVFMKNIPNLYYRYLPYCMLIAVSYWSMFVLDNIGDFYGIEVGCIVMIAYYCFAAVAIFMLNYSIRNFTLVRSFAFRNQNNQIPTNSMELSPMHLPETRDTIG